MENGPRCYDGQVATLIVWIVTTPVRGEYAPVGVRDGLSDFCVRTSGGYEADEDDGDGQQKMT